MVDSTHSNVATAAESAEGRGASVVADDLSLWEQLLRTSVPSEKKSSEELNSGSDAISRAGFWKEKSAAESVQEFLRMQAAHAKAEQARIDAQAEFARLKVAFPAEVHARKAERAEAKALERVLRNEIASLKLANAKHELAHLASKIELTDDKEVKLELRHEKLRQQAQLERLEDEMKKLSTGEVRA